MPRPVSKYEGLGICTIFATEMGCFVSNYRSLKMGMMAGKYYTKEISYE